MKKPIVNLPSTVTVVDLKTGKEEHRPGGLKIMPPAADKCQVCAMKHDPGQPHNAQSLYYQTVFFSMNGRAATWADAIAHCDEVTRLRWKVALEKHWTAPPKGEQPIKHHGTDE